MTNHKIPVTILAATGTVGQRFVQLLDQHPWFEVTALTGSDRTAGKTYGDATHWLLGSAIPEWARSLQVLPPDAEINTPLIFSALPADAAQVIEPALAAQGKWVCSNASAFRSVPDVPLILPEVNPDHLDLLETQQRQRGWHGGIVTNPNCASTGITIVLKALGDAFGLRQAFVVTMQSVSGAGYPGVASLDILDNIIPYISGEEDKVEWEPRKMLGLLENGQVQLSDLRLSAQVNRVSTTEGHMGCLSIQCAYAPKVEEAVEVLRSFRLPSVSVDLPSSPKPAILVRDEPDRPQPRLDRLSGNGMSTVVGRVRSDPLFDLKMVVLSHNTIRGAAGASIYNAELLVRSGRLGGNFTS
jgi:aspartate-semialdehyde dehydrogenase